MKLSNHQKAGRRSARRIKQMYGKDFFRRIGSAGGSKSRGGGFTKDNREWASTCGQIGGKMNKGKQRGACKKKQTA